MRLKYESHLRTKYRMSMYQCYVALMNAMCNISTSKRCQLLGILNELRCHFERIAEESERDIDSFGESATQPIVSTTRKGEAGRPRLALAREQLETLHGDVGFRWADVARILSISERTLRRQTVLSEILESTTTNGSLRNA